MEYALRSERVPSSRMKPCHRSTFDGATDIQTPSCKGSSITSSHRFFPTGRCVPELVGPGPELLSDKSDGHPPACSKVDSKKDLPG